MSDVQAVLEGRARWACVCSDATTFLRSLPDDSVDCVVTSPPYWALRDYSADGQIGSEATPDEYIESLVSVFEGVRRVLRKDGNCFVNLGSKYANDAPKRAVPPGPAFTGQPNRLLPKCEWRRSRFKKKDLIPLPWMFGIAAQRAGWWLRNDVIWNRPDAKPLAAPDRFTPTHEYVLLLTKTARNYWDPARAKEPAAYAGHGRGGSRKRYSDAETGLDSKVYDFRVRRAVWNLGVSRQRFEGTKHFAVFPTAIVANCLVGCRPGGVLMDPFCGSGTAGEVALRNGFRFLGCELNAEYVDKLIVPRLTRVEHESGDQPEVVAGRADGGGGDPTGAVAEAGADGGAAVGRG